MFLYLGFNKLETLPPEIGDCSALQLLKLEVNELKELPPELSKISNCSCPHSGNSRLTYFSSKLCPKKTSLGYRAIGSDIYVFNIDSDIKDIEDYQSKPKNLRICLEGLIDLYREPKSNSVDLNPLLEKMQGLKKLKTAFSESKNKLEVLLKILDYPTEGLYKQQIVEVVIELLEELEDNALKQNIN